MIPSKGGMDRKERLKAWFDRHPVNQDSIGTHSVEREGFKKLLHEISIKQGMGLDVACGTGAYTFLLAGEGLKVTAVDMSFASLEKLRCDPLYNPKTVKAFLIADATSLPFGDAEFTIVSCIGMLEYYPLEEKQAFISEMVRVLSKGGWLVFDIPLADHPKTIEFTKMEQGVGNSVFPESEAVVVTLLMKLGCACVKVQRTGFEQQFLFQKIR